MSIQFKLAEIKLRNMALTMVRLNSWLIIITSTISKQTQTLSSLNQVLSRFAKIIVLKMM